MQIFYVVNRSIHMHLMLAYSKAFRCHYDPLPIPILLKSRSRILRFFQDIILIYYCVITLLSDCKILAIPHTRSSLCSSTISQFVYDILLRILVKKEKKILILDDGFLLISRAAFFRLVSPSLRYLQVVSLKINVKSSGVESSGLFALGFKHIDIFPVEISPSIEMSTSVHTYISDKFPRGSSLNLIISSRFLDYSHLISLLYPNLHNLYIPHPNKIKDIPQNIIDSLCLDVLDVPCDLESLLLFLASHKDIDLTFYVGLTSTSLYIYSLIEKHSLNWNVKVILDREKMDNYYRAVSDDYLRQINFIGTELPVYLEDK